MSRPSESGLGFRACFISALLLLGAFPCAAQLDSLTARQLLQEATAALDSAPELRANESYMRHFSQLRVRHGLSPLSLTAVDPYARVDSLIAAGALTQAVAAVREIDDVWAPVRVMEKLIAVGDIATALAFADSLGSTQIAVVEILAATGENAPSREEKVRIAREQLSRPSLSSVRGSIRQALVRFIASFDFAAAWDETEAAADPADRAWLRAVLLEDASDRSESLADSLFSAVYAEILLLPNEQDRSSLLGYLGSFCRRRRLPACHGHEFPPPANPEHRVTQLSHQVINGFMSLDLAEALPALDSLRSLVPDERLTLLALEGLSRAHCGDAVCAPRLDSALSFWLPRADRHARTADTVLADSLNLLLAGLIAPRNASSAFSVAERIRTESMRALAFTHIAVSLHGLDRGAAWQAAQRGTPHYSLDPVLHQYYLDFMADGNVASAQRALTLMNRSSNRMRAGFAWADRIQGSGQWRAAADFALRSVEHWDPSKETMAGSRGHFNIFARLGTYGELVEWARSLVDPSDRVVSLAAVVESVSR